MDSDLTQTGQDWRARILELQAVLDELRPRLIEAEALLAERLATISAFEFQVRARLESLTRRLDDLQFDIDELRRQLRRFQNDPFDWDEDARAGRDSQDRWRFDEHAQAAASGTFRYHRQANISPKNLEAAQLVDLKQLYRQLARRFHPDLALDPDDRDYRTNVMMAINSAYAAGDFERLQQLSLEPDHVSARAMTDQDMAEAMQLEVDRCRRRIVEVEHELEALDRHDSARLMKRAARASAQGRDLLAELAADLRSRIAEKMVERDVLEGQLEEAEREGVEVSIDDLADIVFNLGLEQADDDSLFSSYGEWQPKNRSRWEKMGLEDEENTLDMD